MNLMVVEAQFIQTNDNICMHYDHTCDMVEKLIKSYLIMTSAAATSTSSAKLRRNIKHWDCDCEDTSYAIFNKKAKETIDWQNDV